MKYSKPHLNIEQQLKLMASRGMEVGNPSAAATVLKRIGYYRLSAYTYPMRAASEQKVGQGDMQNSAMQCDRFVEGACLTDAVALHDFDHRLRKTILPAIQTVEIGLRAKVAYHLSKRDPYGHLSQQGLSEQECTKLSRGPARDGSKYELWFKEYESLKRKPSGEDYVRYFNEKYEGRVPIWAAGEFMTFGCLVGLYSLLDRQLAGRIAGEFGVKNKDVVFGWLKALNVLRNHCAHNARIWNRSTIYPPDRINEKLVQPELHHLISADRNRIYFLLSVLGYLLRFIDPESRFAAELRTTMNKFPMVLDMAPERNMGFMPGWRDEELWKLRVP